MLITVADVREIIQQLRLRGFGQEMDWAEDCAPPRDPEVFARELVFVICNSGMRNSVAAGIHRRVIAALYAGQQVGQVFGHVGKVAAIEQIWRTRVELFEAYRSLRDDSSRLAFLRALPWIGSITQYHAGRNFGLDVVKPDVHLQRLADHHGVSPYELCARLGGELGLRVGTMDAVLWRACAEGLIESKAGRLATERWAT